MARPLRIEFPGALYHLTSRGNAREPIFFGDSDRRLFLDIVGSVVTGSHWLCYAYCLMPNHYHLLVETPLANLSRGMRQLNGRYTQRLNHRHGRVGHVFQGRFKGILVERESHQLELARYVVLNPVRAGLVQAPEDYRWSSLRATLGLESAPRWLTPGGLLAPFGSRERYRQFVHQGIGADSPWSALRGSVLGSEGFTADLADRVGGKATQGEIPRKERLVQRQPLEALFRPRVLVDPSLRNERIREAIGTHAYSLAEVGRHLGLHYSTVSRIVARGR